MADEMLPPWVKAGNCPHCGEKIAIDFGVNINSISAGWTREKEKSDVPVVNRESVTERFAPHELKLIEEAAATGILDAYSEAAASANPACVPTDFRKMFVNFLRMAMPKRVPLFVVEAFNQEFGGHLWFQAANGVVSVASDGKIRAFFPQRYAVGSKIGKLGKTGGGLVGRMPADEEAFEQWVRTKHGYVIGNGAFWEQMTKRSKGEFMDISLTK